MSMIQRASNRSTATNYGIEGQWDIQYNVPALSLLDGGGGGDSVMKNYDGHHPHYNHDSRTVGPFITRGGLRQQLALPSRYILTKTHCTLAQNRPSSSSSRHNIGGLRGIDPLVCYFRRPLLPPDEKRQQHPLSHQLPVIDFAQACASGYRLTRGVENENDVKFTNNSVHHVTTQGDERRYPLQFRRDYVEYAPQSVDKAIHLIRHPLDNLVSRYHLHARNLWNMKRQRQEKDDDSDPYKNYSFAQHCAKLNADPNYACWRPLLPKIRQGFDQTQSRKTNDTDEDDKNNDDEKGVRIVEPPCWPDLLKYVWWHNHAFAMTAGPVLLNQEEDETWEGTPSLPPQPLIQGGGLWRRYWHQPLPTLVLYYEDYNRDLNATRQGLLDWLDQPLVALDRGPDFDWKMYRDTEYTAEERHAVRLAIQTWATPTTWHHLQQRYYSDHQKWHEQSKPKDM